MGTFGGHVLPGSFFIIFSLWWTVNIFSHYYSSVFRGRRTYHSAVTYTCPCLCGRLREWEVEGLVKIVFTAVGFTLEIITAMPEGKFIYMANGQHATMFFFFGMSGVIDILVHHSVWLPKGVEYVAITLSFAAEGILFKYHLMGRDELDALIHTLLVWVVFLTVIVLIVEIRFRNQVLVSLTRAYLVLVQGTWFWQIAFILYNPLPHAGKWQPDNNQHLLMAAMIFAWHMAIDFIVMLGIGIIIASYHRRSSVSHHQDEDGLTMNLIKQGRNGKAILKLVDSDSDVEFERPN